MEFNLDKNAPIGVMDSGMGGISVLRELVKLLPHENFIFMGIRPMLPMAAAVQKISMN